MATKQNKIDEIKQFYAGKIVEWIEQGTTAGDKIYCYDLWYKENDIVKHKRINIYVSDKGIAEFYNENYTYTPPAPELTFEHRIQVKLEDIISKPNIKYASVREIENETKQALLTIYIDAEGTITKKEAYVWEDDKGVLQYSLI